LSINTDGYDRNMYAEMDEEIWSPADSTPIATHFPTSKREIHNIPSPNWQHLPSSKLL
jgi:hypothetical protein